MADDDVAAIGAFAHHYLSGRYSDLRLVAKDGTACNVHRLIVCVQSPVLDAQASTGVTVIELDDDPKTIEPVAEWMYGISRDRLLLKGKSLDCNGTLYGEILAMADIGSFAEKVSILETNAAYCQLKSHPGSHPQAPGAGHRARRTTRQPHHLSPLHCHCNSPSRRGTPDCHRQRFRRCA